MNGSCLNWLSEDGSSFTCPHSFWGKPAGVLTRKFDWDEEHSSQALRALGNAGTVVYPGRLPEVIEGGHADNRILDCAVEASADYLVTSDRRHLLPLTEHRGTRILNAPRFLLMLGRV